MKDVSSSPDDARSSLTHSLAPMGEAIATLLRTHPEGLSELSLLKALQNEPWQVLGKIDFRTPTALYPVHFLLFHVLYQWRDDLHRHNQTETLHISPLNIQLRPLVKAQGRHPGAHDPLADFYRDLDNLDLSDEHVEQMVDNFWRGRQPPEDSHLARACEILEVSCPPPSLPQVRLQFRRMVMRHHPDRGGCTQRLQSLNDAMTVLRHYFSHYSDHSDSDSICP